MYTTVVVIAIIVIAVQLQMASLKAKIAELHTENEILRTSIKNAVGACQ